MLTLTQQQIIKLALEEDLKPYGDLSSALLLDPKTQAQAQIIAKEPGIMACSWIIEAVIKEYMVNGQWSTVNGNTNSVHLLFKDGEAFQSGDIIAKIHGSAQVILAIERTILNFMQRLCGVATYTHKLVELVKDYPCKLLDTRKTMPGMRLLEKEAFRCGGGTNHRLNLSDMVMLKENHLALAGLDLIDSINEVRSKLDNRNLQHVKIEVEINKNNLNKLDTILQSPVDIIMLDNFSPQEAEKLIKQIRSRSTVDRSPLTIELSGGINEHNIIDYAKTGANYLSTSAAFTQANNIDLSMLVS